MVEEVTEINTMVEELTELNESKLGTQQHWDSVYTTEIENFNEFGDKGEVWFGEDSAERMLDWCSSNIAAAGTEQEGAPTILDLGCGNGHLVFGLFDLGFKKVQGCDYSTQSIDLCKRIAEEEGYEGADQLFWEMDILKKETVESSKAFNVLLDKGTFDAISLGPKVKVELNGESALMSPADIYVESVKSLLPSNGILLLTSCNWIESEILTRFEKYFQFHSRIKYPTFQFGGVKGQTITTIALKRI